MSAERQYMRAGPEVIKRSDRQIFKRNDRLTPAQYADAKFQVEAVYGLRALEARQAQFDFNPDKSTEQNTKAIHRQYAVVSSPDKIRAHVEKLTRIIEENKKKNAREGGQYHQDAKLLETMSTIADTLKWFGPDTHVTLTSLYDDVTKGVDMVIEWRTKRNGKTHIMRLGVDLTLLRRGRDADKDWKLQKKQQGGVMRDLESQQSILLDGALRHLDYFKSQLTHGDWHAKRFVRTPIQNKKIVSRRAGVFVPTVVASLEKPLDLYRLCGDLYDADSSSVQDIEKNVSVTNTAKDAFAHHPLRISLLESTLNGVKAQIDSLADQKFLYRAEKKIQDQIVKALEEFRSIKKELEKNIVDAKGEIVVPIRKAEMTSEAKRKDEAKKNAFDALRGQEARLRKFIQTFERDTGVVLPPDIKQTQRILYDTVLARRDDYRGIDLDEIGRSSPFDARNQKDQNRIQTYLNSLSASERQDFIFQERLADIQKKEEVARMLLEVVGLLKGERHVRAA